MLLCDQTNLKSIFDIIRIFLDTNPPQLPLREKTEGARSFL